MRTGRVPRREVVGLRACSTTSMVRRAHADLTASIRAWTAAQVSDLVGGDAGLHRNKRWFHPSLGSWTMQVRGRATVDASVEGLESVWAPARPGLGAGDGGAMAVMGQACTGRGARAKPGRSHGTGPARRARCGGDELRRWRWSSGGRGARRLASIPQGDGEVGPGSLTARGLVAALGGQDCRCSLSGELGAGRGRSGQGAAGPRDRGRGPRGQGLRACTPQGTRGCPPDGCRRA